MDNSLSDVNEQVTQVVIVIDIYLLRIPFVHVTVFLVLFYCDKKVLELYFNYTNNVLVI